MSQYNYNVLKRTNDGTNFEWNTNSTVLFIDQLPTGITLNLHIDDESNPGLLLREKTQLRFKESNRLIFKPSGSTSGTIRIFLYYDQSNTLEFDQAYYATNISGTIDVDLVGQSGVNPLAVDITEQSDSNPLKVDITAQTLSPLVNNLTQIAGSTTEIGYFQDMLTQFNGMRSDRTAGWTYLVTGTTLFYTSASGYDTFVTSCQLSGFQLSAGDATLFLYHGNSSGGISYVLLTFTMNEVSSTYTQDGTNTVSMNFGSLGYKIPSGDTLYIQSVAAAWGSGTFQGYRVPT